MIKKYEIFGWCSMKYKGRIIGLSLVVTHIFFWNFHQLYHMSEDAGLAFEILFFIICAFLFWWIGRIYDVNKAQTKELKTSNERFQTIFEHAGIGIALIDKNGRPVMVNPKLQEVLGYSEEELTKFTLNDFSYQEDSKINFELLQKLVNREIDSYSLEKRYIRKDGEIIWGNVTSTLFPNSDGKHLYVLGMVIDITEQKETEQKLIELNKELEHLSNSDGLTAIANRRYFDEQLMLEWELAKRNQKMISLIMLDIDFFKKYNDTYGHIKGDYCLKNVANILKYLSEHSNCLPARYGGEEFAVIIPYSDQETAQKIAEQIRLSVEALKLPHEQSNVNAFVTVSIGLASIFPTATPTAIPEDIIKAADMALYQAKLAGRNRICSVSI